MVPPESRYCDHHNYPAMMLGAATGSLVLGLGGQRNSLIIRQPQ